MWVVGSNHHQFWVGTEDWSRFSMVELSHIGGLLTAPPELGGAYIITKVHTGLVNVDVHYHHTRPELDLDPWEDADLVVIDSPLGDLCVLPIFGHGDFINEIVPHPGVYAVCCSARGRDDATTRRRERRLRRGSRRAVSRVLPLRHLARGTRRDKQNTETDLRVEHVRAEVPLIADGGTQPQNPTRQSTHGYRKMTRDHHLLGGIDVPYVRIGSVRDHGSNGLITTSPDASNGARSRVAIAKPWAAAIPAM